MFLRCTEYFFVAVMISVTQTGCARLQERKTVRDFDECFLQADDRLAVQKGERPVGGAVMVSFLGTSSLLFDDGETQILIDGFVTRPSNVLGPWRRIATDPAIAREALSAAGVDTRRLRGVFVAHSHYDHALDSAWIASTYPNAVLFGSSSTMRIGESAGLQSITRGCAQDPAGIGMCQFKAGQQFSIRHFRIHVLESKHSPPTLVNDDLGESITKEFESPAHFSAYTEGGSFDFLIEHDGRRILVKPGANYVDHASPEFHAEVLFLGTGRLMKQLFDPKFKHRVYSNTVGLARPQLVIPVHWDDFTRPLSEPLTFPAPIVDNSADALNFLVSEINASNARRADGEVPIAFRMLQRYQRVMLFRPTDTAITSPSVDPGNCQ